MDQFLAQISVFGFNFAPYGWAQCQGQLLPISQYSALFSLIGTYYGGNGTSNFGLPNFQGLVGVSQGQGPGLQDYVLGEIVGSPTVALTISQMPMHTHSLIASTTDGTTNASTNNQLAKASSGTKKGAITANYLNTTVPNVSLNPSTIGMTGGNVPHNNMQPYLVLNYCISLTGAFPPRS